MTLAFIHEIKLASDKTYEGGTTAGTAIAEGFTWAISSIDSQQGFVLSAGMTGFLITVANDAAAPLLAKLGQASSSSPDAESGAVPVLQGAERYIRASEGDQLFLIEAA